MTERETGLSRKKKKSGNSQVESNDSPKIPDGVGRGGGEGRRETSDIPGFPSGIKREGNAKEENGTTNISLMQRLT